MGAPAIQASGKTGTDPAGDGPGDDVHIARLAKALGHPARVQIVRELLARESCIGCDLADAVGLAASTTSEHLRILKGAGIITGQIERPRVCYALNPAAVAPLRALVDAVLAARPADADS